MSMSGDVIRQHVLVSDQKEQAITLERVGSGPPPITSPSGELISRNADPRNKSQPVMSGFSSRTQQIDAKGKIRHVFLINQPSNADLNKHSSNEKLVTGRMNSRRLNVATKRRRRRRPSSSRLRKRGNHFKLNSDQSTCGEEIATVRGGSTGRDQQDVLSPDKHHINRRVSHQQIASLDISRPNLGLIYKTDSKSNSNRSVNVQSMQPNIASSSSNESQGSLRLTSQPEINRGETSDKAKDEAILSGSVHVSRASHVQTKYFSLEANKIATVPAMANKTPTGPARPYDSIL